MEVPFCSQLLLFQPIKSHLNCTQYVFLRCSSFGSINTGHVNLMYVCPCIIYENDERYQLDATILFIVINNSTYFGHLYAHLQEYIGCILLHMLSSTKCCGCGPDEPVCSLVHCV